MSLTAGIVICTRNRIEPLMGCLDSISRQTRPAQQLIIVDSSDSPLTSLNEFANAFQADRFPTADLTYLHTTPGLAFQRNRGLENAAADVIFFFDDDVVLSPNYVEIMLATFEAHPEYGGGMGQLVRGQITRRPADYLRGIFLLTHFAATGTMQRSGMPTYPHGRSEFMEVEILSGAAMAYRAKVTKAMRFDERLTGYAYMEDVDFSYRASRQFRLFYQPEAHVEHHHVASGRSSSLETRRMLLANHSYLFFKSLYPQNHWWVICYAWAVVGLIVLAALARQWDDLRGYVMGVADICRGRVPYSPSRPGS